MPLAFASCILLPADRVEAAVTVTVTEAGGNVVFSASGTLNTTGLTYDAGGLTSAGIRPDPPSTNSDHTVWTLGADPGTGLATDGYLGFSNFGGIIGPGTSFIAATSGTGDRFGINDEYLILPEGFVSGASIASSSVFASADFSTLGLSEGTYVWDWGDGDGLNGDTLTLTVVPEPATTGLIAGLALLGFAAYRRRR